MRAAAWVVLAALLSGCVLGPPATEPTERPSTPGPTDAPGARPAPIVPTASATPGPTPAETDDAPPDPPGSDDPPPGPGAPPETDAAPADAPPPSPPVVWPRQRDTTAPAPPARFEPGLDAPDGAHLLTWTRADDGLGFSASLAAVAEATLHVGSIARIVNDGTRAVDIILDGDAIADPHVSAATLGLWDEEGALLGRLDLLAPTPLQVTLPPGATLDASWTITLAEGAQGTVPAAVRLGVAA